jgi:hypothetical protein
VNLRCLAHPIFAMGFVVAASTAWASKPMVDVPLTWRPTSTIQDFKLQPINLTQLRGVQILNQPFTNACPDKTLIGENREDRTLKTIRTNGDVAAFATDHTKDILKGLGFPFTDKPEQANAILSGELFSFGVVERDTYVGDVRIRLTIRRGGEVVWEGLALGQATRFSQSYKLENYYEVLTDSLLEAIARMGASQTFLDGLSGKATVVPAAVPPVAPEK